MRVVACVMCLLVVAALVSVSVAADTEINFNFNNLLEGAPDGASLDLNIDCGTDLGVDDENDDKPLLNCEVAIVGGGMGGHYTAERLAINSIDVCVFERENRWGGRILDIYVDEFMGANSEPIGLGAWRFSMSHDSLLEVINRLGVPYHEWNKSYRRWEARGYVAKSEHELLINAFPDLKARFPDAEDSIYFWDAMFADASSNTAEYQQMIDTDFFSYIRDRFGGSALEYLRATNFGFSSDFFRTDVRTYFEFLDNEYTDEGPQQRPLRGMLSIIDAIRSSATSNGARFYRDNAVLSVDYSPSGHTDDPYYLTTKSNRVRAKKVIITPGPLALAKISGNVITDLLARTEMQSLLPEPVFKAGMIFDNDWWKTDINHTMAGYGDNGQVNIEHMSLVTTLSTCLGLVMPALQDGPDGQSLVHVAYGDGPCAYLTWPDRIASMTNTQLADHIIDQLRWLWKAEPGADLVNINQLAFHWHYWDEGAWHMQKGGYGFSLADISDWAVQPLAGQTGLYLVGEAYGVRRTWSEGAIEQSKRALTDAYGITHFCTNEATGSCV